METQTLLTPTKDPRIELAELKLAVRMFCHTMEMCALLSTGLPKGILQIQMDTDDYKKMKQLI